MKKLLITTACALAFASWNVLADDAHHPDKAKTPKAPVAVDTGKMVQKVQNNIAPVAADTGKTVQKVQDNMKK